jgi:hypothetical protein
MVSISTWLVVFNRTDSPPEDDTAGSTKVNLPSEHRNMASTENVKSLNNCNEFSTQVSKWTRLAAGLVHDV